MSCLQRALVVMVALVALSATAVSANCGSPEADREALAYFNSIRARHGSPPVTWNEPLSQNAQGWADRCDFKHSIELGAGSKYGENGAGWQPGGKGPCLDAIDAWLGESNIYDWTKADTKVWKWGDPPPTIGNDNPAPGSDSGHFAAVVWHDMKSVGCGAATNCPNFPWYNKEKQAGGAVWCEFQWGGLTPGAGSPYWKENVFRTACQNSTCDDGCKQCGDGGKCQECYTRALGWDNNKRFPDATTGKCDAELRPSCTPSAAGAGGGEGTGANATQSGGGDELTPPEGGSGGDGGSGSGTSSNATESGGGELPPPEGGNGGDVGSGGEGTGTNATESGGGQLPPPEGGSGGDGGSGSGTSSNATESGGDELPPPDGGDGSSSGGGGGSTGDGGGSSSSAEQKTFVGEAIPATFDETTAATCMDYKANDPNGGDSTCIFALTQPGSAGCLAPCEGFWKGAPEECREMMSSLNPDKKQKLDGLCTAVASTTTADGSGDDSGDGGGTSSGGDTGAGGGGDTVDSSGDKSASSSDGSSVDGSSESSGSSTGADQKTFINETITSTVDAKTTEACLAYKAGDSNGDTTCIFALQQPGSSGCLAPCEGFWSLAPDECKKMMSTLNPDKKKKLDGLCGTSDSGTATSDSGGDSGASTDGTEGSSDGGDGGDSGGGNAGGGSPGEELAQGIWRRMRRFLR